MNRRALAVLIVVPSLTITRSAEAQCGGQVARDCAMAAAGACMVQYVRPYSGGAGADWNGIPVWDLLWDPSGGGFFNQLLPADLLILGFTLEEYRAMLEQRFHDPNETVDDLLGDALSACTNHELMAFGFQAYNACVALMCSDCTESIPTMGGSSANCLWYEEENRDQCTSFFSHDQCTTMYGQSPLIRAEPDVINPPSNYIYETGYSGWSWMAGGYGIEGGWSSGGDGGGGGGSIWALMCTTVDWYTCVSVGGVSLGCSYDYSETTCEWEPAM